MCECVYLTLYTGRTWLNGDVSVCLTESGLRANVCNSFVVVAYFLLLFLSAMCSTTECKNILHFFHVSVKIVFICS